LLYFVSQKPFPHLFLWEKDQENRKHLSIYLSPGKKGVGASGVISSDVFSAYKVRDEIKELGFTEMNISSMNLKQKIFWQYHPITRSFFS